MGVLLISIILIGCASIYTYAHSGNNLSNGGKEILPFGLERTTSTIREKFSEAKKLVIQHKQKAMEEIEKEVGIFFSATNAVAKQDIKNHQEDYITRLTETKERLRESNNFQVYADKKKNQVNHEINQEVEVFIKEMLSE